MPIPVFAMLVFAICTWLGAGVVEALMTDFATEAGISVWSFVAVPGLFAMLFAFVFYRHAESRITGVEQSTSRALAVAVATWIAIAILVGSLWCPGYRALSCTMDVSAGNRRGRRRPVVAGVPDRRADRRPCAQAPGFLARLQACAVLPRPDAVCRAPPATRHAARLRCESGSLRTRPSGTATRPFRARHSPNSLRSEPSALRCPTSYGGAGMDYTALAVALEEIAAGDGATSTIISVNNCPVCSILMTWASESTEAEIPGATGARHHARCVLPDRAASRLGRRRAHNQRAARR
jgi:hypothetical protein